MSLPESNPSPLPGTPAQPAGRMEGVARARHAAGEGTLPEVPWLRSPGQASLGGKLPAGLSQEARLGLRAYVRNLAAMEPLAAGTISRLILFGSHARGDAREESDVDVALVLAGEAPVEDKAGVALRTMWSLVDAEDGVLQDLLIDMSSMVLWESELHNPDSHSNPWFVRNILAEGIEVTVDL